VPVPHLASHKDYVAQRLLARLGVDGRGGRVGSSSRDLDLRHHLLHAGVDRGRGKPMVRPAGQHVPQAALGRRARQRRQALRAVAWP
jgi:hypothetical protein